MSKKFLASALASLTVITFVAPAALIVAPQKASASATSCVGGLIGGLFGTGAVSFLTSIRVVDPATVSNTGTGAGAGVGACINDVVLKPLARSMIRNILQSVTASIISWINGGNGSGHPSFVRDLTRHLQAVGDAVTLPFVNVVRTALNPAFAGAIASSLLTNYAQQTSVGGFLAANQSTLMRVSPNPNAFIAGDFSQGGIPAWFALTTRSGDNPYLANLAAKSQLGNLIGQAQTNRRQDLTQSNGFLSWCGPGSSSAGPTGVSPGASCFNSDGTSAPVKTPGTVIRDYTQQALGADMAQLINPSDIDSALAAIFGAALNQGIRTVLGGSGLFGASMPSSIRPQAITSAMQTAAVSNSTAVNSSNAAVNDALSRSSEYSNAWRTIAGSANSASSVVTSLKSSCASQASAADVALGGINSVLLQAQVESRKASNLQTNALNVQAKIATASPETLASDTQALAETAPLAADVTEAQSQAQTTYGATADPSNPLSVTGGSLVDQMNLISQGAQTLIVNCPIP